MKTITCRGLLIHLDLNGEPQGVFWPRAIVEDSMTGERRYATYPGHIRDRGEALRWAESEGKRLIRAGNWQEAP